MTRWSFRVFPIWLVAVCTASQASADIRVTLSDGQGTIYGTAVESGNVGGSTFTVAGTAYTITANMTNFPGTDQGTGSLSSTLLFLPTQNIARLTVLVEDVVAPVGVANPTPDQYTLERFPLAAGPTGYLVTTRASENSGIAVLDGTAQVNGQVGLARSIATSNVVNATNSAVLLGSSSGFTLAETYTLTNVAAFVPVNVSFSTTVSRNVTPNATPEPSTFVLVGLTGLGVAGVGCHRRWRVAS